MRIVLWFCLILAVALVTSPAYTGSIPVSSPDAQAWIRYTVPLPKSISIPAKIAVPAGSIAITVSGGPDVVVTQACSEIRESLGLPADAANPPQPEFTFRLQVGGPEAVGLQSLTNPDQAYLIVPEADNTALRLVATTSRGLYYAAKTLQQLLRPRTAAGIAEVPLLSVTDWPDIADRGMWGGDTFLRLRWMADRKMNIDEQVAARYVNPVSKVATAYPKAGREALGNEGPLYGIQPVHAIPHMELHAGTGVFQAYPNLIGINSHPGAWCYSQPQAVDVLAAWIAALKSQPYAEDVSVWLSENLAGGGGCKCSQCSRHNRDLLEAQTIVAAWQKAKQTAGNMGLRLLTSEETRDSNSLIFQSVPAEVKIWYYDSLYTYTTGRTPIVSAEVANLAASGRYAGVVPSISAFVTILQPFSSPHFARYRMSEFVDKGISGFIGYATPMLRHSQLTVEGAAEWSWNSGGRSTREFAASYAVRQGFPDPEKFADWAEAIGSVEWDIYGSDWPRSETRSYPGPVAARLKENTLPALGTVNGTFRGPWGEIKTVPHLDGDLSASVRALRLAREMGDPELIYESLVTNGHICALKALYELKGLVRNGAVSDQDRAAANTQFRLYVGALRQVVDALQKWDTLLTGSSSYVTESVNILQAAIDGMTNTAAMVGCGTGGALSLSPASSIAEAKEAASGTYSQITDVVVTSDLAGYCYVQEPDRTAGIRVQTSKTLTTGSRVTILGTTAALNGERCIQAMSVASAGTGQLARPLLVTTRNLGGGWFGQQPPVKEYRVSGTSQPTFTSGLNNIGLLVRFAGAVSSVGPTYLYVDDGSGCNDGSGAKGVRVISGSFIKPSVGDKVAVTGVSSVYYERAGLWRAVVLPTQESWQFTR